MLATLLAPLLFAVPAQAATPATPFVDEVSKVELEATVYALVERGPRPAQDTAASLGAVEFLEARLAPLGFELERESFTALLPSLEGGSWSMQDCWNLVATQRGLREPDVIVELGAHLDSMPECPGADDNGSGVATLLEIARIASEARTTRTLRLVFYGAEEVGLLGSAHHAQLVAERVRAGQERFHGALVVDMIAYGSQARGSQQFPVRVPLLLVPPERGNFLFLASNTDSKSLARDFRLSALRHEPDFTVWGFDLGAELHPMGRRGDHASYWDRGLRAFTINDTAELRSPHYHLSTDTADTLDYELLLRAARSCAGWALDAAVVLEVPDAQPAEAAAVK